MSFASSTFFLSEFISASWDLFGSSLVSSYFWPFTEVKSGNHREVTKKVWETF